MTDHHLAAPIARHWAGRRARRQWLLRIIGPEWISGASDVDPSGIAAYSQVGAQFGYGMTLVMPSTWPLMAAIQEISARIGRVTGEGIAGNIRANYPPWLLRGRPRIYHYGSAPGQNSLHERVLMRCPNTRHNRIISNSQRTKRQLLARGTIQ
jgi:Natural resistance-associated macrophage protein-like